MRAEHVDLQVCLAREENQANLVSPDLKAARVNEACVESLAFGKKILRIFK